jgi:hypothetical protein
MSASSLRLPMGQGERVRDASTGGESGYRHVAAQLPDSYHKMVDQEPLSLSWRLVYAQE